MIIDFHIHSKYSFDCFLEPAKIITLARRYHIDGLAIADHETMAGVAEFRTLAPDLYIICAQEMSTRDGDIIGLFLKDQIQSSPDSQAVIQQIRAQGGLAILAHPFKWPHLRRRDDFLKKFDGIEVFNARNNIPAPYLENHKARAAVKRLNLAGIAGSDTHEGFEMGRAKTIFDFGRQEATDEKIKRAILERKTAVEGQEVFLPQEIASHFSRNFKSLLRR
jgi:predicted metal-dependent phosphoesterase TrpH